MEYSKLRVIISGGGTGGHIFPAVSIAKKLKEVNPETEILFVGAEGKMEMEKVPREGFRIVGLPIVGLQRQLNLKNIINDVQVPFRFVGSIAKARKIIKEFKPQIAVGVGGYASAPLLMAATRMKIPALIQEQNGFAGLTNKMLGDKVQSICVAYEGMERFFPADKIPRRQDCHERQSDQARDASLWSGRKGGRTQDVRLRSFKEAHTHSGRKPWKRHPQQGDESLDRGRMPRRRRSRGALAVR